MAIIRKHQPNTSSWFRQATDDAFSIIGERVIYLEMFSPKRNHGIRCSVCYSDVYSQSTTSQLDGNVCGSCYGTTYENGIYRMFYTDAIIGKSRNQDSFNDKKGYSNSLSRSAKMLWPVQPYKDDYLIRIFDWANSGDDMIVPVKWETYKVTSDITIGSIQDGFHPVSGSANTIGTTFTIHEQGENHPLNSQSMIPQNIDLVKSRQPFLYIPDYIEGYSR